VVITRGSVFVPCERSRRPACLYLDSGTVCKEGFFMYFRFYGPLEPFYDKSWRPDDVVKVN
jgi:hypothetical protein